MASSSAWQPPALPTLWGGTGTPPCRAGLALHSLPGLEQGWPGLSQQLGAKAKQQISCLIHMLFLSWATWSPTVEGIFNEVLCPIQISPARLMFSGGVGRERLRRETMGGGGNGKKQATAGEFEGINMKVDAVPAGQ